MGVYGSLLTVPDAVVFLSSVFLTIFAGWWFSRSKPVSKRRTAISLSPANLELDAISEGPSEAFTDNVEFEKKKKDDDKNIDKYILGGGQVHWLPTSFSLMATMLSSVGLIALPTYWLQSGIIYTVSLIVSQSLCNVVVLYFWMPMLYEYNIPSVFNLMRQKYGNFPAQSDYCK